MGTQIRWIANYPYVPGQPCKNTGTDRDTTNVLRVVMRPLDEL